MELISDNELSLLATGNCSPPGDLIKACARELQRYRAAGPLPFELLPGQRWENKAGGSYTIGETRQGHTTKLTTFFAVHFDRFVYDDCPTESLVNSIREGNYRLVAGPGAPKSSI